MTQLAQRRLLLHTLFLLLLAGPTLGQQFPAQGAPNPLRSDAAPAEPPATPQSQTTTEAQSPPQGAQQPQPAGPATDTQATAAESTVEQEGTTTREAYDAKAIQDRLDAVDTLQLTEEEKSQAKQLYQDARQSTDKLQELRGKIAEYSKEYTDKADSDKSKRVVGHSKPWYDREVAVPQEVFQKSYITAFDVKSADMPALEERATKMEQNANFWSKHVKELETKPATRKRFLASYQTDRQQIEQQLSETVAKLEGITEIANEVTKARQIALTQQAARLEAQLQAMEEQRAMMLRGQEVFDLELELAKRKAAAYEKQLELARNELSERRKQAAAEQMQAARRQTERNKQLIDRNSDSLGILAGNNQGLTAKIQEVNAELDEVQAETDATDKLIDKWSTTYAHYVEEYGDDRLTQAGGELLRSQKAKLPSLPQLRREIAQRTSQKNDVGMYRAMANGRLAELQDLDKLVQQLLEDVSSEDRAEAEPVVREMLASQEEYLENYITSIDALETKLDSLISSQESLRKNVESFQAFIAERDLWIRSCRPMWAAEIQLGKEKTWANWRPFYLRHGIKALAWSLSPQNWLQVLVDLRDAAYREPLLAGVLIATFLLLLYSQRQARKQIKLLGAEAAKRNCTEFFPSLRTLWLTLVVSLPWPLLLWGLGWLLRGVLIESEFSLALSQSLRTVAWVLLLTEFFRQSCRTDGLADAHLGWPRAALTQLRRYLRWMPVFVIPLMLWFIGLDVQNTDTNWSASLGRVLYLVVLAYFVLALWRLLMSHSSAIYQTLERGTENWLLNMHRVWRPALVLLPVALGIMAAMGYYYTAEQLGKRTIETGAMLLVLMIAGGLLRRWVLLNRRQLAREQARQRRAQAQAQAAAEGDEMAAALEVPEDAVDLTALSEATRKLLRMLLFVAGVMGAIFVWQDVFPALAWLDGIALPGASGDSPSSWGDLLKCLVAVAITYVAVRDLPSLLELVVLQHLPIDQGARYAVSMLARYTLLAVGIVTAAGLLGITGTSISWLVAAMGVGLGFGLQEIFANFVSGIILLFERPIRVGDIITLGDKTGIVNRIRMRATTIVDWDRKEYVVPNKDLVTERLLNWTLSDQTNRIVINVGVAYGSDTERAIDLLHEIVGGHPDVLEDPAPVITFEGFGDSTLNLVVRCYLPTLERRIFIISELHTAINKRFNAEGIEIAFPQRDLHIRSMPPGWASPPGVSATDNASTNGHAETPTKSEVN